MQTQDLLVLVEHVLRLAGLGCALIIDKGICIREPSL